MQTKYQKDDLQVLSMCDYGAKEHIRDQKVMPRFHIMGCEVDLLKRYMKEKYPNVPYQLDYPSGQR